MSINDHKPELFRLAAVLYADNNYEVNIKTIHRKIIESILLEINSNDISPHQIIDYAQNEFDILIEEEDINKIVDENTDKFHSTPNKGDRKISLTPKRKLALNEKIKNKTIDFFICEFEKEYTSFKNTKEIIYRFLYGIFSTNTESFKKLLDKTKPITDLFNPSSTNYSDEEKEIINAFLFWDNSDKNKSIFDISSYALEYCMLTNKNGATSINLNNLKNKSFYLDTNIIYRGLGINGENRKNRTEIFLKKCLEAEEKLIISRITDLEFKESLKKNKKKIEAYYSPRVKSDIYNNTTFNIQHDIFYFYHKWRCNTINDSIEIFEAYILNLYSKLKKEFNIDLDVQYPYDSKEQKTKDKIDSYTSDIHSYKPDAHITQSEFDAQNVFWIENKRNDKAVNIFDTTHYFISTDQILRRWDYQRKELTPLVILPSQWMSILLRYFDCTSDDYKSFISFLNLKSNEKIIDGETVHVVIAGIAEMTENLDHQNSILEELIGIKFKGVVEKESTKEQIFENSKQYAKTQLEIWVEEQQINLETLEDKHNEQTTVLENLTQQVDSLNETLRINEKTLKNQAKNDKMALKEKIRDLDKRIKQHETQIELLDKECIKSVSLWKERCWLFIESIFFVSLIICLIFAGYYLCNEVSFKNREDFLTSIYSWKFICSIIGVIVGSLYFIFGVRKESYFFNYKDTLQSSRKNQLEKWKENNPQYNKLVKELERMEEDKEALLS